eukprot:CAMPEP_0183567904 /NCGR_PEP_ID=MMETSP0371-20130417/115649_1 /TAXON_ID=268820 /ORGANISM="Peridinium aciculiferum, Strain PAER-2" /LENGTH=38 /DNA_ID= /DNA_START= /DNA_END= /DNA_ORIENTATION=
MSRGRGLRRQSARWYVLSTSTPKCSLQSDFKDGSLACP